MDAEIDQKPRFWGTQAQESSDSFTGPHLNLEIEPPSSARVRSSQRLRYEAEAGLIQKKIGDLEAIRNQLGLSQRKICQLLLVDPSAWTRWTKTGENAPPHIYRALQWYLLIQEKYPALDVNFWLSTVARTENATVGFERDRKIAELGEHIQNLMNRMASIQRENELLEEGAMKATAELRSYLLEQRVREKKRLRWLLAIFMATVVGMVLLTLL